MAENFEKAVENILNELKRLSDVEKAYNLQKKSPGESEQIQQIAEALRKHGLTLVKTAAGYDVVELGEITVQSQKKSPGQTDQIHCKHRLENNGVCPQHNLQCGWPKCNEPEQSAQQEPVGEVLNERGEVDWISFVPTAGTPLYTRPQTREPLTDEQFAAEWRRRVDEVAHGIKENT